MVKKKRDIIRERIDKQSISVTLERAIVERLDRRKKDEGFLTRSEFIRHLIVSYLSKGGDKKE